MNFLVAAVSSYLWLLLVKHFETRCALCYHEACWEPTRGMGGFSAFGAAFA